MDHNKLNELKAKYPGLRKVLETGIEANDDREQRVREYVLSQPELKGDPMAILGAMDKFARQQDFLINLGEDKARILADLISSEKPKTFVEIGGYVGYSALLIGHTMRSYDPTARVWSLELKKEYVDIIEEIVAFAGLSETVKVVMGAASESLKAMKADGRIDQPDMILLDHVEKLYISELQLMEELGCLKVGTIIVADNVIIPGAPEYQAFVRGHGRLNSEGVRALITPGDVEDEFEISRVIS